MCDNCYSGFIASSTGSSACQACQLGYEPTVDLTACVACAAGKYAQDEWGCYDCFGGQVSTAGSSQCESCAAGKFAQSNQCVDCDAGKYSSQGWDYCESCFGGTAAGIGSSTCESCPAGKFALDVSSECTNCAAGEYSLSDSAYCFTCDWDTVSKAGDPSCKQCLPGRYANDAFTECLACAAGTYKGPGDQYCWECFDGWYSGVASSQCEICPAGRYGLATRDGCADCAAGKYTDSDGQSMCFDCFEVVQANSTQCGPCEAGSIITTGSGGIRSCTACEAGKYSTWGGDTVCYKCDLGTYSSVVGRSDMCTPCPGDTTYTDGSSSLDDCLQPTANQSFECSRGKSCSISGFLGVENISTAQLMIKFETCASSIEPGGYGSGYGGDFGYGGPLRRLQETVGQPVTGFSSESSKSSSGISELQWEGRISAEAGAYRICWCGGRGYQSTGCMLPWMYAIDAGTMVVAGPFSGQKVTCVIGRLCQNLGPIKGLGMTEQDKVTIRQGCTANVASQFGLELSVVGTVGSSGELELYVSQAGAVTSPPGSFALCWCSSKGGTCTMSGPSFIQDYAEAPAAELVVSGPKGGNSIICARGQPCYLYLLAGGTGLVAGDRTTVMQQCGWTRRTYTD